MKQTIALVLQSSDLTIGKFFNTLSMMEYIGARKIIKSQNQDQLDEKILSHMYEEIRHAHVLKRVAIRFAPMACDTYAPDALLAGEAAVRYMQTVDAAAKQQFGIEDSKLSYLYTTLLVEERANQYYALIDEGLQAHNKAAVFRGILVEEERHLEEIFNELKSNSTAMKQLEALRLIEQQAFNQYLVATRAAVS